MSIGEGIKEIFQGLGVDYLIEGGQTMNPSTEDMLTAIEKVNAKNIFILPNNKNIILAANQAKAMTEDKNIIVVPTKTVPQGITAMISYVPEKSAEENEEAMTEGIQMVKTGQERTRYVIPTSMRKRSIRATSWDLAIMDFSLSDRIFLPLQKKPSAPWSMRTAS